MSRISLRFQIAHCCSPIVILVTPAVLTEPASAQSAMLNSLSMACQVSRFEENPDPDAPQPYFYRINENEFGTADEYLQAETGWEDPDGVAYNLAEQKITPIRRDREGNLTVRINVPVQGSGNASLFGRQPISATIQAGSTFTGKDRNRNNMPDVLEELIKKSTIRLCPCPR